MSPENRDELKNELKTLFYSNLSAVDLQKRLNLNHEEYLEILSEVKEELGLPSSFKRLPHMYNKYVPDAFFIKKSIGEDFEILAYTPTYHDAENKLCLFDDGISVLSIEQATEEHMMELIEEDYYEHHIYWNELLKKYQIGYHKFFDLLRKIKEKKGLKGTRTSNQERYIYKYNPTKKYYIKKTITGQQYIFGYYNTKNAAIRVRDYLEEHNWNKEKWDDEKEEVIKQLNNA